MGFVFASIKVKVVYWLPKEYSVLVLKVCSLFTIPVTSPIPIVVAFSPIVKVLVPISSVPIVLDGLALCKLRIPFIVQLQHALIPAPLIVKLFILLVKIDSGQVMVDGLVNTIVADELLASIFPLTLVGELPEIVKVFAPIVNVPAVKANIPATVTSPPKLIPFARFKVKLFSETTGNIVLAPLPPKTIFDVLPPFKVPELVEIAPLIVKVFAPMLYSPMVSVRVVGTIMSPFWINPWLLLSVNASTVLLTKTPVGIL